jgi:HEXXH motif-containing protein
VSRAGQDSTIAPTRPEPGSAAITARARLEGVLAGWAPSPAPVLELRRLHAAALHAALERSLVALAPQIRTRSACAAVQQSTWTAPELAYALYVEFADDRRPSVEAIERTHSTLVEVAQTPCPSTRFGGRESVPEWVRYALRVFEQDQARDGRTARLRPHLADARAAEECRAALERLRVAWPEMAETVDVLVREIVWFDTDDRGSRSATLTQAYGAVFLYRDVQGIEVVEHLVHEATHLELTARMAVDPLVVNRDDRAPSPFRERPRPLGRVLHACVVAARIAAALDRCDDLVAEPERTESLRARARAVADFRAAMESLESRARWTERGSRLFGSLRAYLEEVSPRSA